MERSAEWLRGEKAALRRLKPEVWGQGLKAYSTRDLRQLVDSDYFKAERELAAAEAREAFPIPDTLPAVPEVHEAGERKQSADDRLEEALNRIYAKYGPRLDLFFADVDKAREAVQLTAAEVIEELHGCFDTIKHLSADIGNESGDIAVNGVALLGLAKIARWKDANHAK